MRSLNIQPLLVMKSHFFANFVPALLLAGVVLTGCATDSNRVGITNPKQIGPVVGQTLGAGVGVVGGNAVGGVVGFGEGVAVGAQAPFNNFNNAARMVRRWRTEVTSDGRTIQVPEDILVDIQGRPISKPSPK